MLVLGGVRVVSISINSHELTCADPNFSGGEVQAWRPENSLDNVFFFVFVFFVSQQLILQFTEDVQWFYSRENYTFEGSRGVPTLSRGGGPTFSTGGGGPNANFYRNSHILWLSRRGFGPPIPPSGSALFWLIKTEYTVPNLVCGCNLGWQSVAYHFQVTVALISGLAFRISMFRAYIDIIWSGNPNSKYGCTFGWHSMVYHPFSLWLA